jgi:LuxR family maltose regulon positive regulatory protein
MQAEPAAILRTKLYMPPIRRDLVARQRLVEQLDQSLWQRSASETPARFTRKLTIISAPAGFGKTTLVCQWINDLQSTADKAAGLKTAWLSVDKDDNDLVRFLKHLVAALQTCQPKIGLEVAPILQSPPLHVSALLPLLLNDLSESASPLFLVLDDYHLIEAQPVHNTISALIEGLPPQVHVVIATRADPPFPLARWRARGQLTELRLADLRFNLAETNNLLDCLIEPDLPDQTVYNLFQRTEGWVAGLQLAALAMRVYADAQPTPDKQNFLQDFTGSNRFILDYLIEEVLQHQPKIIQAFLLQTSILNRLCAPLCDAILGDMEVSLADIHIPRPIVHPSSASSSQTILEYLDHANLFLIPLDSEQRWYRYHQLFADLLQKQLLTSRAERLPELHCRASQWLESAGLFPEAIEHSLAAGDLNHAASLIERMAESLMLQAEIRKILHWLDLLPEDIMQVHPNLQMYQAWMLAAVGHPLEEVEALVDSLSHQSGLSPGRLEMMLAMLASLRNQFAHSVNLARSALQRLPSEALLARTISARILGLGLLSTGDISEGFHYLEETIQKSQQMGQIGIAIRSLILSADLHLRQAQLQAAQTCYERAIAIVTERGLQRLPEISEAHIGLGELQFEYNQPDAAEKSLLYGILIAQKPQPMSALRGYICLAHLKQAQNDPTGADEYIQQARKIAEQFTATQIDDLYVAMHQASLWIKQGKLDAAAGWISRRGVGVEALLALAGASEDAIETHQYKYEALVVARWLLRTGQTQDMLPLLEAWLPRLEHTGRISLAMEFHILRALALYTLGSCDQALAELTPMLQLGQAQGYVRRFLDAGPPMRELLQYCIAQAQTGPQLAAYIQTLLDAFDREPEKRIVEPTQPFPTRTSQIIESLSAREMEVLRLLCTNLTIHEITSQLYIAESTLRSHIKSIYSKLGVHSRLEAIQQTKALNLL